MRECRLPSTYTGKVELLIFLQSVVGADHLGVGCECQHGSGRVWPGYCDVAGGAFPDAGQKRASPRSRAAARAGYRESSARSPDADHLAPGGAQLRA
jgi:hypothetical protein